MDITMQAEKVLDENRLSEEQRERTRKKLLSYKEAIVAESNKMEGFVTRILDSTQPLSIRPTPTVLFNLVEKIIEIYRNQPYRKKIVFLNQVDPGLPLLQIDKAYFEEVFDNLFSNSVYAIENNDHVQGGYVRINSHIEKQNGSGKVIISVEDNGSGIDETHLKHIFKPHFSTKKQKGNGRGLFIVQRILDKHKASMTVESKVTKGTKMSMHVPYGEIHV